MRTQTARCCCGDFTITVSGEPNYVHTCHCDYCQRRTGSVFQVSALYGEDQIVSRSGDYQVFKAYPNSAETFSRANVEASRLEVEYRFCKRCGSTVYWEMNFRLLLRPRFSQAGRGHVCEGSASLDPAV